MPTPCLHFQHLRARLEELRVQFLDDDLDAENADPVAYQPNLDRIAAFRLLVHAEFETFLEEKAKENIAAIQGVLSKGGQWQRQNPAILSLYYVMGETLPVHGPASEESLRQATSTLLETALTKVRDNNGVKERAFVLLSVMAGKALDEIDVALLSSLNSFGKERGEVAHKSVGRTRTITGPSLELGNSKAILDSLQAYFDVC